MSVGLDTRFYSTTNSLRSSKTAELERGVIDAAIEFRKRRMDIQPDAERKSIFDAGATFDVQLNDFIRAIDRLIKERERQ